MYIGQDVCSFPVDAGSPVLVQCNSVQVQAAVQCRGLVLGGWGKCFRGLVEAFIIPCEIL